MPNAAVIGREDGLDEGAATAQRQPGQFARSSQGAPWVAHPKDTTKHKGNKKELILLCAERGLEVPDKVTVNQLHEILGARPKRVMYGRPSSLGKQIENMTNLQKWAERGVALGLYLRTGDGADNWAFGDLDELEVAEGPITLDNDEARPILDQIAAAAKHAAGCDLSAERGTFIHKLLEAHDVNA